VSGRYAGFLKAACEAVAAGCAPAELAEHEVVRARVDEFWRDAPSAEELSRSGLAGHPLLQRDRLSALDTSALTAKEHLLLKYLQAHPNQVCEKDELIRAVWSEDKAFVKGIRDDSLAQLVRRLREKIEVDPSNPKHIFAVPGRGYRFAA
jgi:DNA-binding response OmpR family regulator